LTVVTSDRAIRDSVLRQGAKTVDSATFTADLAGSGRRRVRPRRNSGSQDRRLSVDEIQEWLEVFGQSG
jgi:predicted RNA-binding protein with PIN domain